MLLDWLYLNLKLVLTMLGVVLIFAVFLLRLGEPPRGLHRLVSLRSQFTLTLILMLITLGIWYTAGTLFAVPAMWLTGFVVSSASPQNR